MSGIMTQVTNDLARTAEATIERLKSEVGKGIFPGNYLR